ncbi:MAG: hypothetical protein J6Y70_00385 [Bacilli bacterium]|nr:hypothetical protein [Bacilli bacterium]
MHKIEEKSFGRELVAAIEICEDIIKIVIGYEYSGDILVIYKKQEPIKTNIQTDEEFQNFDKKEIFTVLKKFLDIKDSNFKLKIKINKAVIILPSIDLKIFEIAEKKPVSNLKKISFNDMENIINSIKETLNNDQEHKNYRIVDIIPILFNYDTGCSKNLPINVMSDFLEVKTSVQMLPTAIINNYDNLMKKVTNYNTFFRYDYLAASQAIAFALKDKKDYICINVEKYKTFINIVSGGIVVCTDYFAFGSHQLIKSVSTEFEIDDIKAKKLCSFFGLDKRVLSFDPVILNRVLNDNSNIEKKYKLSDLNKIIEKYFNNFFFLFDSHIKKILEKYGNKFSNFIFLESDFKIYGFFEYIKNMYKDYNVEKIKSNIFGARDDAFLKCVGAILAANNDYNYKNFAQQKNKKNKI